MACDLFKIIDKIYILTSVETNMFYKYQIIYFVLSGNNNSVLILIYKVLFLIIKFIVKIHVIYIMKELAYRILS